MSKNQVEEVIYVSHFRTNRTNVTLRETCCSVSKAAEAAASSHLV